MNRIQTAITALVLVTAAIAGVWVGYDARVERLGEAADAAQSSPGATAPMEDATSTEATPNPLATLTPDPAYETTRPPAYAWAAEPALIAHGMGGIGEYRVTNAFEAFQDNYAEGYRIFEVDLVFSSDGRLVARHDWLPYMYEFLGQEVANPDHVMSAAEFSSTPIHGSYTPLTIEDIVTLMKAYPDIYVLTDTKSKEPAEVRAAMEAIRAAIGDDEALSARFIIQIYNEPMLAMVRDTYGFQNVVYTLYQLESSVERAITFAAEQGIDVIAIPEESWSPELIAQMKGAGLTVGVYTVNDAEKAATYRDSGVTLLYSDFLTEKDW